MKTEEKKKPFWETGVHPILGAYYNGSDQGKQAFHGRELKKKQPAKWGDELNKSL